MTYRARWDAVANPQGRKDYPIDITEAIAVGDLMWWDKRSQVARSFASASAWTGSTAGTQAKMAENFIGVAQSAHPLPDNPQRTDFTTCRIGGRGTYAYPLTTAVAVQVGDYVTASKDPSGNLMFAQQVDKGAIGDPGEHTSLARELAIGKITRTAPSSAPVAEFEILGTREAGGTARQYLTS